MAIPVAKQIALMGRLVRTIDRSGPALDRAVFKAMRNGRAAGLTDREIFGTVFTLIKDDALRHGPAAARVVTDILVTDGLEFPQTDFALIAKATNLVMRGTTLASTVSKDYVMNNTRETLGVNSPRTPMYTSIPQGGACDYCVSKAGERVMNPNMVAHHPGCLCIAGVE